MDRQSFEKLFKDNYSKAYYLALRILHNNEVSKDVVSDAFELVWKRVRYQDVDNISSYLLTTVKNVSLDYIRRQDIRSRYVLASMKETEMVVNSVYDHWDVHEEKIKAIMGALTELTPRTQQIVQLCYVEHKKYREVAAELDISESAVKKHIMQALSYMRQKFKGAEFY